MGAAVFVRVVVALLEVVGDADPDSVADSDDEDDDEDDDELDLVCECVTCDLEGVAE